MHARLKKPLQSGTRLHCLVNKTEGKTEWIEEAEWATNGLWFVRQAPGGCTGQSTVRSAEVSVVCHRIYYCEYEPRKLKIMEVKEHC